MKDEEPQHPNEPNTCKCEGDCGQDAQEDTGQTPQRPTLEGPVGSRLDRNYLGRIAYEQYAVARKWLTYGGTPMPQWNNVETGIREAWEDAAVSVARRIAKEMEAIALENPPIPEIDGDKASLTQCTKALRVSLDRIIQVSKAMKQSCIHEEEVDDAGEFKACCQLSIRKQQEAVMWFGMGLKALGATNPYPHSYDPKSPVVDPTAQGMKL